MKMLRLIPLGFLLVVVSTGCGEETPASPMDSGPGGEVLSLNSVQNNLGCNQHPNIAGQQAMGTTLAARIWVLMGW